MHTHASTLLKHIILFVVRCLLRTVGWWILEIALRHIMMIIIIITIIVCQVGFVHTAFRWRVTQKTIALQLQRRYHYHHHHHEHQQRASRVQHQLRKISGPPFCRCANDMHNACMFQYLYAVYYHYVLRF